MDVRITVKSGEIDNYQIGTEDKLIWSCSDDGSFFVKSFITSVESNALGFSKTRHTFDNIWQGIVPPRVEMMGWFLILGKLNTMKRLAQINVVGANEVTCALCGLYDEDIDHLFIHCNYVFHLWNKAIVVGEIIWVKPKGVRSFFEYWCKQEVVRVGRRRWINCWFAIVWVICWIRNQFIFERNDISWENAWEFIMYQLKEWEMLNKRRKEEQSTIVQGATSSLEPVVNIEYEFSWWICDEYVASKQCMAVGGYLVNAENNIVVLLCEFLNADSRVNVLVECIEASV
ncbi:uncharacterized protein LOC107478150 [Arachis duranensis]|uniref:Uncharacterized protein LOC107478150 n=1 Tax=Arachis duranensis TaxID=130453 RepID=A0A6P4CMZ7_ARADU|nr:uncharacterized protein LOC107478150 [Arachis duranensis]